MSGVRTDGELVVTLRSGIEFPPRPRSQYVGQTKYPFDIVAQVGDGFEVNRGLPTMRAAVNKYNRKHRGIRKFAVRFVDGRSLVKRIL